MSSNRLSEELPIPAMSAVPSNHESSHQHFSNANHKEFFEAMDNNDGLDDRQLLTVLRKIRQKRVADTNTSDLRAGDTDLNDKQGDKVQGMPGGHAAATGSETPGIPLPPGLAVTAAGGSPPTIVLPVHEHGQTSSSTSASDAQSSSRTNYWTPTLKSLPSKNSDVSSDKSFSVLSTTSKASSKKSHKSNSSTAGSFSVVSSGTGRGVVLEGDPAPAAWPLPPAKVGTMPTMMESPDVEEETVMYEDAPHDTKAGPAAATGSGSAEECVEHDIGTDPSAGAQAPDPAYALRVTLAAAPAPEQKRILYDKILSRLIPIIPIDVKSREAYARRLMQEDNNILIEYIFESPPFPKLRQEIDRLHLLSRAEIAEESAREAEFAKARAEAEATAKTEDQTRLRHEYETYSAQNQAEMQRVLLERDNIIASQKQQLDLSAQALQEELRKHTQVKDQLKDELNATLAKSADAQREMQLRESNLAKQAEQHLRAQESEVEQRMRGEMQAIKEHYANEDLLMKKELESKVQAALNEGKKDLAQQLSDKYNAAHNEQVKSFQVQYNMMQELAEAKHSELAVNYQQESQKREQDYASQLRAVQDAAEIQRSVFAESTKRSELQLQEAQAKHMEDLKAAEAKAGGHAAATGSKTPATAEAASPSLPQQSSPHEPPQRTYHSAPATAFSSPSRIENVTELPGTPPPWATDDIPHFPSAPSYSFGTANTATITKPIIKGGIMFRPTQGFNAEEFGQCHTEEQDDPYDGRRNGGGGGHGGGGGGGREPPGDDDDDDDKDRKKKSKKSPKKDKDKKKKKKDKKDKKKDKKKKKKERKRKDRGGSPPDDSSSSSSSSSSTSSDAAKLYDSDSSSSGSSYSSSTSSSNPDDTELTKVARYMKKQSRRNNRGPRESIPDRLLDFPSSLPKSTTIRHWKLDLQRSIVRAAKSHGKKARKWIRKCWPDSGTPDDDLIDPGSKFYWLDNLIKEALVNNRMCSTNVLGRRMLNMLRKAEEKGKDISGRSWVRYVLQNCLPDERLKTYFDTSHLLQVRWLGDNKMEAYLELMDFILEGMDPKNRPSKDTMHEIIYKQWKQTHKMKWDVEYYDRVTQDEPKRAKKVRTYKWIRKRIENYIKKQDQDAIELDWDHEVRRITGHDNPAAAGIGFSDQFRARSSSRARSRSFSKGKRRQGSGSKGRGRGSRSRKGSRSSGRSRNRSGSDNVCRSWRKNGKCPRGNKCKYQHPSRSRGVTRSKSGSRTMNRRRSSRSNDRRRSGSSGRRSQSRDRGWSPSAPAPPKPHDQGRGTRYNSPHGGKRPCKFFAQGRCNAGAKCKWSHEAAPVAPAQGGKGGSRGPSGGRSSSRNRSNSNGKGKRKSSKGHRRQSSSRSRKQNNQRKKGNKSRSRSNSKTKSRSPSKGKRTRSNTPKKNTQRRRRRGKKRRPTPFVVHMYRLTQEAGFLPVAGMMNFREEDAILDFADSDHNDSSDTDSNMPPLHNAHMDDEPAYWIPPAERIQHDYQEPSTNSEDLHMFDDCRRQRYPGLTATINAHRDNYNLFVWAESMTDDCRFLAASHSESYEHGQYTYGWDHMNYRRVAMLNQLMFDASNVINNTIQQWMLDDRGRPVSRPKTETMLSPYPGDYSMHIDYLNDWTYPGQHRRSAFNPGVLFRSENCRLTRTWYYGELDSRERYYGWTYKEIAGLSVERHQLLLINDVSYNDPHDEQGTYLGRQLQRLQLLRSGIQFANGPSDLSRPYIPDDDSHDDDEATVRRYRNRVVFQGNTTDGHVDEDGNPVPDGTALATILQNATGASNATIRQYMIDSGNANSIMREVFSSLPLELEAGHAAATGSETAESDRLTEALITPARYDFIINFTERRHWSEEYHRSYTCSTLDQSPVESYVYRLFYRAAMKEHRASNRPPHSSDAESSGEINRLPWMSGNGRPNGPPLPTPPDTAFPGDGGDDDNDDSDPDDDESDDDSYDWINDVWGYEREEYTDPEMTWDSCGDCKACYCWACNVFFGIDVLSILRDELKYKNLPIGVYPKQELYQDNGFLPGWPNEIRKLIINPPPKLLRTMQMYRDDPDGYYSRDPSEQKPADPKNALPGVLRRCGRHWDHMLPPGPRSTIPHDWHLCDRCVHAMYKYRMTDILNSRPYNHVQTLYSLVAPYIDNHWCHDSMDIKPRMPFLAEPEWGYHDFSFRDYVEYGPYSDIRRERMRHDENDPGYHAVGEPYRACFLRYCDDCEHAAQYTPYADMKHIVQALALTERSGCDEPWEIEWKPGDRINFPTGMEYITAHGHSDVITSDVHNDPGIDRILRMHSFSEDDWEDILPLLLLGFFHEPQVTPSRVQIPWERIGNTIKDSAYMKHIFTLTMERIHKGPTRGHKGNRDWREYFYMRQIATRYAYAVKHIDRSLAPMFNGPVYAYQDHRYAMIAETTSMPSYSFLCNEEMFNWEWVPRSMDYIHRDPQEMHELRQRTGSIDRWFPARTANYWTGFNAHYCRVCIYPESGKRHVNSYMIGVNPNVLFNPRAYPALSGTDTWHWVLNWDEFIPGDPYKIFPFPADLALICATQERNRGNRLNHFEFSHRSEAGHAAATGSETAEGDANNIDEPEAYGLRPETWEIAPRITNAGEYTDVGTWRSPNRVYQQLATGLECANIRELQGLAGCWILAREEINKNLFNEEYEVDSCSSTSIIEAIEEDATSVPESALVKLGESPIDTLRRHFRRMRSPENRPDSGCFCEQEVVHWTAHAYVRDEAIRLPGEIMRQYILTTEYDVPTRRSVFAHAHHNGINLSDIPWHHCPPAAPALLLSEVTDPTARNLPRTRNRYEREADSSDDERHPEKRARASASSSSFQ